MYVAQQFTPLSGPMAHVVRVDLDSPDDVEVDQYPVVGVLVEHEIDEDGQVVGDRVSYAIYKEEIVSVNSEYTWAAVNVEFVAVLDSGAELFSEDVADATKWIRRRLDAIQQKREGKG